MAAISREAKILIAVLLLGVASYIGWNFWTQFGNNSSDPTTLSASTTPSPTPLTVASPNLDVTTPDNAESVTTEPGTTEPGTVEPGTTVTTESSETANSVTAETPVSVGPVNVGSQPSVSVGTENDAPSTIDPTAAPSVDLTEASPLGPQVSRELSVATLPFLITSPLPENATTTSSEDGAETTLNLPASDQRISINPFAPLVIREEPIAAAAPPAPEPINVDIPPPPTGIPAPVAVTTTPPAPINQVIRAPAPQPVAPPAPQVRSLPRALPSGTLPVTPSILRTVRRPAPPAAADLTTTQEPQDIATVPDNLASQLTLRVPESAPTFELSGDVTLGSTVELPEPLRLESSSQVTATAQPVSASAAPLSAGVNSLSRFVRDNDIRFTGSVLGPIGVGVFRSTLNTAPTVIALGQTIPNTDIYLTEIKGEQAVLTQNDQKETLILDTLRR